MSGPSRWWAATLALAAVRLALAAWAPLADDEGYYWVWSRHLAASYYDHPPLVAWLVAVSTRLCGVSALALRLPSVLLCTATALALRALVRATTCDRRLADRASLLFQVVPVFFGIGFLVIPDAPLHFFWLLAALAAWRARAASATTSWVAAGVAFGGAFLSKYVGVLVFLSLGAYLIAARRPQAFRGWLTAGVVAALLLLPVLWWNAHHEWASFHYQFVGRHRLSGPHGSTVWLFLASQALYLSPGLFLAALPAALRLGSWGPDPGSDGERFLWWLAVPTLGFFLLAASATDFKPNWPAPGYLTLLPLILLGWQRWRAAAPAVLRWAGGATVALACASAVLPVLQLVTPIVPLPRGADPTADMRGWREVAAAAEQAFAELRSGTTPCGRGPFYAAGRYQLASRLEFYLRGRPEVVCLHPGRDAYDDWQDLRGLRGRDFVFLASDRFPAPPQRLAEVDSVRVFRRIVTVARPPGIFGVTVYQCRGFSGSAPDRPRGS